MSAEGLLLSAWTSLENAYAEKRFPSVTPPALAVFRHLAQCPSGALLTDIMSNVKLDYHRALRSCEQLAYALMVYAPGTVVLQRAMAFDVDNGGKPPFRYILKPTRRK